VGQVWSSQFSVIEIRRRKYWELRTEDRELRTEN